MSDTNDDMFDESHWVDDGCGNAIDRPSYLRHSQLSALCSAKHGFHIYTEVVEHWPDEEWPEDAPEMWECCSFQEAIEDCISGEMGGPLDENAQYGRAESGCCISGYVVDHLRKLRDFIDGRIAYLERLPECPDYPVWLGNQGEPREP